MENLTIEVKNGKTWYGVQVSDYALENGKLDYNSLAEIVGNTILNNELIKFDCDYWDIVQGCDYNEEEDNYYDIFQYYIIDNRGVEILEELAPNEIIYYNEKLDVYLWGITHWGTSWDYVLTDIKLDIKENH